MHYYNEYDKHAAAWLRELIAQKLIPAGEVDERSILDVQPDDLRRYTQCHFFAGVGGWAYALRLAGIPATRRLWTGSCPCQPFSTAGRQKGQDDERHLWPAFFNLIRECRPDHVFGEQVANAIGHGWLDGISSDLEAEGYACGAAVLGAHSVGAPHIRQRLYWVANNNNKRPARQHAEKVADAAGCGEADTLAESNSGGWIQFEELNSEPKEHSTNRYPQGGHTHGRSNLGGMGNNNNNKGLEVSEEDRERANQITSTKPPSVWSDTNLVNCRDGKVRRIPTEPSLFPLAHGVPGRVGLLRGSGNAIVPQVAAEFILAAEAARLDRA